MKNNKREASLSNVFLNFNRICFLAKKGVIPENKLNESIGK